MGLKPSAQPFPRKLKASPPSPPLPSTSSCGRAAAPAPENFALFNGRPGLRAPGRTMSQAPGQKGQKAGQG